MKKFTKLSLVAAVAVAGLSSASAKPLEEAIKDVDVSGSVVYRYNDYRNDKKTTNKSDSTNNYKIGVSLKSKVNDYVTANVRAVTDTGVSGQLGFASLNTQQDADANPSLHISNAYFGLTAIPNTTVNVGKQGLTTPWTVAVDTDGNEQNGTGALALTTIGNVTAGLGYFNQTNLNQSGDAKIVGTDVYSNLDGTKDIVVAALIGNFDFVSVDAWYLDLADTFDTYTIGAKANFELLENTKIGIDARYASLSFDKSVATALNGGKEDNSMAKLVITGKAGIINAKVAYAMTDKDGGLTSLDNDANTTLLGWNINSNGKYDADYYQLVLGVDILDNLNLSANYGNIEYKNGNNATSGKIEEEEIYAQLTYKMSKNLNTYVRYGTFTKETTASGVKTKNNDDTRGRLQVEYTF
ncbi:porin [Aliarcobacter skirrowii]|uniref:porin n=1 Tax=Aliarcobacter skirrowii TaxID=28200 RepID=UPI002A35E673|nr:porin [Aliarcobacter skirrowii]MDY0179910.1 major outer membrane protein [Aliarcobacter skirrowii]